MARRVFAELQFERIDSGWVNHGDAFAGVHGFGDEYLTGIVAVPFW
jgi:hypothetical protein